MKLSEIQMNITKGILGDKFNNQLVNLVIPGGELSQQEVLKVYRGDYTARMSESIGNVYEAVWNVLGDQTFNKLVTEYLLQHTSQSFDVGLIGKYLPTFLKNHKILEDFPFLYELAIFEKSFDQLFHSNSSLGMRPDQFSQIDNLPQRKLVLTPAHFFYSVAYPIFSIWNLRKDGDANDINWENADNRLFYKNDTGIKSKEFTELQADLWKNILTQHSLAEAIELSTAKGLQVTESEISEFFAFLSSEELILQII